MTTFQLLVLPLLGIAVLATVVAIARRRVAFRIGVGWVFVWLAAAAAIADPDILVRIAHLLGIGRGADLVLYLSILFTLVAFFLVYLRFRRLDEQITILVRQLAIRDVRADQTRHP